MPFASSDISFKSTSGEATRVSLPLVHTMRCKPVDRVGSNHIPCPALSARLDFSQIILLVVVEVEPLIIIARERLFKWNLDRTQVNTIILNEIQRHASSSTALDSLCRQSEDTRAGAWGTPCRPSLGSCEREGHSCLAKDESHHCERMK